MVPPERHGFVVEPGEGEQLWFAGELTTVKIAGEDTRGAFAVLEVRCRPHRGALLHTHHEADEAVVVLEGTAAITCGPRRWSAPAGAVVLVPAGVPHAVGAAGDVTARVLLVAGPAGFDRLVARHGVPAAQPAPGADLEQLAQTGAAYGFVPHGTV